MGASTTRLHTLLRQRHWQTYGVFCKQYDEAAQRIDPGLVGGWPSRAQLHRWVSGELKRLPRANHCRVLEGMFPGWSAGRLFERCEPEEASDAAQLLDIISTELRAAARDDQHARTTITPPTHAMARSRASAVDDDAVDETAGHLAKKLTRAKRVHRMSVAETRDLASLAGRIVEMSLSVVVDIDAEGAGVVSYQHEIINLTDRPLTRLARELWFEHVAHPLEIDPIHARDHRVAIQRLHDAGGLAKFGCRFSPAVRPGDTVMFGYVCRGARFVDDHYWRQSLQRPTRHLTVVVRHADAGDVRSCSAIEEHANGAENSIDEHLIWEIDDDTAVLTLTRDNLASNQAVTVRWEIARAAA